MLWPNWEAVQGPLLRFRTHGLTILSQTSRSSFTIGSGSPDIPAHLAHDAAIGYHANLKYGYGVVCQYLNNILLTL